MPSIPQVGSVHGVAATLACVSDPQRVQLVASEYVAWVSAASAMAGRIAAMAPGVRVEHIGSTAVPGLAAKPVVDLLVGVCDGEIAHVVQSLASQGFDLEGQRDAHAWLSWPHRQERAFVVHVVPHDGVEWCRRVAFRDLLRRDATARAEYLAVKREAAAAATGWADYTAAKADTVQRLLGAAGD